MEHLIVKTVPYFGDNFCYLIHCNQTGTTSLIDCGEAAPVLKALDQEGWTLHNLFITHYHSDHSAGIPDLVAAFPELNLFKPQGEERLTFSGKELQDGEEVAIGTCRLKVYSVVAHTKFCTAFYFPGHLFVGDALFSAGCGRLFEGQPLELATTLKRLASFPDETKVYVGHEYTLANLKFAQTVDPQNQAISSYARDVQVLRNQGKFSTPTSIAQEKKINPFFRVDHPHLIKTLDPQGKLNHVGRVGLLRRKKDLF